MRMSAFNSFLLKKSIPRPLYSTHIKTNVLQKAILAAGSSLISFANPQRADMVATLGETTGYFAAKYMRNQMEKTEEGRAILREKPRVHENIIRLDHLKTLPRDTLGGAYAAYMSDHGFIPSERPAVRFIDDVDLAYVMTRYREVHDFWHALSGLPPTILGELGVKWLEWTQTGLPMTALSSVVGPLMLSNEERKILFTQLVPWALKCGNNMRVNLMSVYYERHLERKVEDIRNELGFIPPPQLPPHHSETH